MAKSSKRGAGQAAGGESPSGQEAGAAGMPDPGIREQTIRPPQKMRPGPPISLVKRADLSERTPERTPDRTATRPMHTNGGAGAGGEGGHPQQRARERSPARPQKNAQRIAPAPQELPSGGLQT